MADEQVNEVAGQRRLIELKGVSEAARVEAQAGEYSADRWAPWLESAAAFNQAVTDHAKAHGLNRFDVEKTAVKAAGARRRLAADS